MFIINSTFDSIKKMENVTFIRVTPDTVPGAIKKDILRYLQALKR
jgi:hypothetical protein